MTILGLCIYAMNSFTNSYELDVVFQLIGPFLHPVAVVFVLNTETRFQCPVGGASSESVADRPCLGVW